MREDGPVNTEVLRFARGGPEGGERALRGRPLLGAGEKADISAEAPGSGDRRYGSPAAGPPALAGRWSFRKFANFIEFYEFDDRAAASGHGPVTAKERRTRGPAGKRLRFPRRHRGTVAQIAENGMRVSGIRQARDFCRRNGFSRSSLILPNLGWMNTSVLGNASQLTECKFMKRVERTQEDLTLRDGAGRGPKTLSLFSSAPGRGTTT
jgi:hypothetical protein